MKPILYFAAASVLTLSASCEHSDIAPTMDVQITLDESNSYLVGEPVRFNFGGQVDNVAIWTGDATHEYKHRERTQRDLDLIESARLEIQVLANYGTQYGSLVMGVSDKFDGLIGPPNPKEANDGMHDKKTITSFGEIDAWTSLDYLPLDIAANTAKTVSLTKDVSQWASNFSIALRWKSASYMAVQRSYSVTPVVTVSYKDNYPTQTLKANDLGFVALSMAPERAKDVYDIDKGTAVKGAVSYASFTAPLFMNGSAAWTGESDVVNLGYAIDTWCISTPRSLATVAPDKGVNIKNLSTDLHSYEYTYSQQGTYTVTFVLWSGNYAGAPINRTVEFNITIIKPI